MTVNKLITFFVILSILIVSGCSTMTSVTFRSNVDGATVIVDGVTLGKTPFTVEMSNLITNPYYATIIKEGYQPLKTKIVKEPKIFNIVTGVVLSPVTFFIPLLWIEGPMPNQYFTLNPIN